MREWVRPKSAAYIQLIRVFAHRFLFQLEKCDLRQMRFAVADEHCLQRCAKAVFGAAIVEYVISSDPVTFGRLLWQMADY